MILVRSAFSSVLTYIHKHITEDAYRLIRDAGIRSEFLLRVLDQKEAALDTLVLKARDHSVLGSNAEFLQSRLRFVKDVHGQEVCLARSDDGIEVGVMMGWERHISKMGFIHAPPDT
jgi:protein arginine N-methyltransferase 2